MDAATVTALAQARARKDAAYQAVKDMEESWKSYQPYREAAAELAQTTDALDKAEADFRQDALSEYGNTHQNKAEAYEIKITKSINIPDEGAAIRWSITNFTPALALNKKVFETAVKAGSIPVELAFMLDQPKVFIKADLSEWLK